MLQQKLSTQSNEISSSRAISESVAMHSDYLDPANRTSALDPLSPAAERLLSVFAENMNGIGTIPHAPRGSSNAKALLFVVGIFLFLTAGAWVIVLALLSDRQPAESAITPIYPRGVTNEASFSSAAPASAASDGDEVLPAEPTRQAMAEGKPWSSTMEAYKALLGKQGGSNASAPPQMANDHVLGQYEAWLKAKPQ
jgi:hypothetical protein